jgi:hypothetical protein
MCAAFEVSARWVYKHSRKGCRDALPFVRLGRSLRFDPDKVALYLWSRERHRPDATLDSSDGIARVSRKGKYRLTRKRFQTGSVRLREDRGPAYWQGFYREDIVDEAGRTVRKRVAVNLGPLKEIPNEKAARAKLAVILDPINDAKHRPKKMMTFRSFIEKYRALKLANQKGTTKHGYETNIRAHYLPEFGDFELSDITIEAVQAFLNQKTLEGKAVQTLKNLKWGLSSIFRAAMKYGYMKSNPARGADLPPEGIKERHELPSPDQLNRLIERLKEPLSTAVWLTAVTCVRPEELAFKWKDLNAERRELWVVRAVNRGKLHTPKYHRSNRPIRLTEADVERLLALKAGRRRRTMTGCFRTNARPVRSGMRIFSPGAFSPSRRNSTFRTSPGVFSATGEPRRWWKDMCPSRRRKSALDTRAPTFFSSSMPMSWTNRRTWRQRP